MKHIVKAFVYGFRVPGHEHVLGFRPILVCLLHIPISEIWRGMDRVKTPGTLKTTGAKMEKTRQASPRYKK